jgi:hypothetical protein
MFPFRGPKEMNQGPNGGIAELNTVPGATKELPAAIPIGAQRGPEKDDAFPLGPCDHHRGHGIDVLLPVVGDTSNRVLDRKHV